MLINGAYIKVHQIKAKSVQLLIGFNKEGDKLPLYMVTASKKSFDKALEEAKLEAVAGSELVGDVKLIKDNQFRTWLNIKAITKKLN